MKWLLRWSLEIPEMSGKCKSNPTKTNNLIYILKITQKNEETDPKKRKPINKLRIWNFFWKPETDPIKEETDPKKEETDPKNEETDQQTGNLQLFENRKQTQKIRKRTQ